MEGGWWEGGKCPNEGGRSELAAVDTELLASPSAACSPKESSQGFRASAAGRTEDSTDIAHPWAPPVQEKLLPKLSLSWSLKSQSPSPPKTQTRIAQATVGVTGLTLTSPRAACCAWESCTAVRICGNYAPHPFHPWVLTFPQWQFKTERLKWQMQRSQNAYFLKVLSESLTQFPDAWHIDIQLQSVQLYLVVERVIW